MNLEFMPFCFSSQQIQIPNEKRFIRYLGLNHMLSHQGKIKNKGVDSNQVLLILIYRNMI